MSKSAVRNLATLASRLKCSTIDAITYCEKVQELAARAQSYKSIHQALSQPNTDQNNLSEVAHAATKFHEAELRERVKQVVTDDNRKGYPLCRYFLNQVVAFDGDRPFGKVDLERIVASGDATIFRFGQSMKPNCVVIGRTNFDRSFLNHHVANKAVRFMSQEDFLNHLLFNIDSPYFAGDVRITEHPGLSYLASVGMKWPALNNLNGDSPPPEADKWDDESELKGRFGYSVEKGISGSDRRECLRRALNVNDPRGWTLQRIANHIHQRIALSKRRNDSLMVDAIARWEADLKWLKETFYTSHSKFRWPYS